jgi:hypothetical protein
VGGEAMSAARKIEPAGLAMHSAESPDWGTPPIVRRFSACFLRPSAFSDAIDLDYASSAYWNSWWPKKDQPTAFLDGSSGKDVLVEADRRRAVAGHGCGAGHFNPPGANGGEMVQKCWELFESDHRSGWLHSGVFIGFSLEQLTSLQGIAPRSPLSCSDGTVVTIIPCRRIRYELHPDQLIALLKKKQSRRDKKSKEWLAEDRLIQRLLQRANDEPVPGLAPTHASYITCLPSAKAAVRRRQFEAARQFLAAQAEDPKSPFQRYEVIGSLEMR